MSRILRVVFDPGHGGLDPGAIGKSGLMEKTVNWMLVNRIHSRMERLKGKVESFIVQPSCTNPNSTAKDEIYKVVEQAKQLNPDLFVSIHCNAGGGKGFESYVHNLDVGYFADVMRKTIHDQVMRYLVKYDIKDRGKKSADFAVLREVRKTGALCMLFENLFLDNVKEEALLKDEKFLDGLANEYAYAICVAFKLL